MTATELRNYIPLMPIASPDDDCIASRRGDLTFGWRIWLPVAYTVSEAGYDSILSSFLQAYRLLPDWCVVHKQDVFCHDVYRGRKEDEFLMGCYERFHDGRVFLDGRCYLYLTFSTRQTVEAGTSAPGRLFSLSARPPTRERIRSCASFASQFEAVLSGNPLLVLEPMKARDFLHTGPDGRDAGTVADYLRFWDLEGPDYDLEMTGSTVRCGDTVAAAWYVEDSDAYPPQVSSAVPVAEMSAGPAAVFLSGGSPFGYALRIPHVVNRYIVTMPRGTVEAELNLKKRLMTSFSAYSARSRINSIELEEYLEQGARSCDLTVKCFTDIIAWGREQDMRDMRRAVVTAFSSLGIAVTEERRFMPSLHYAGIPGAAAELGSDYLMTGEMNAFLCHGCWDGFDGGMPDGSVRLCDRRRMVPLTLDMQTVARDMGLVNNLNMLVVGPSGSGKSFTMNHIVNCLYAGGQHGLIIDVGDSYEGLCRVISEETGGRDGVYNTYSPDSPLSFNPFRGRKAWGDVDSDGERVSSGQDFVFSLLYSMYEPKGGWTADSRAVLEDFLHSFFGLWDNGWDKALEERLRMAHTNAAYARWEHDHRDGRNAAFDREAAAASWLNPLPSVFTDGRQGTDPVFDDFCRYMSLVVMPLVLDGSWLVGESVVGTERFDVAGFCIVLGRFARNGQYGFLLNAREERDLFASRLTCYEVDRIKGDSVLFPLWMLSIMHSFEDKMRTLECPKFIVIEEAWSAVARPEMAGFIVWLWRTARKFKTSAIVVTQSVADLTASEVIRDAIILNTSTKILLDQGQNANRFGEYAELLALTPMDVGLVLSVNRSLNAGHRYKEAFIAVGDRYSNVFAVEVSPEQALAYESDKTRKAPLLRLAVERGSMIAAIRETVEARRMTDGRP